MVSGHTRISARSGNSSARWRLICSGLHFTHSFDCTTVASSAWSNLLALGRRPRSSACFCAAYGAYFPRRRGVGAEPLRASSRLTVAADRPIPTAIARTPAPPRYRSAICSRSSKDRYRPDGTGRFRGSRPPVACRHLRPVALLTPTASLAPVNVEPPAINTQNRACLSISSCFNDMLQHLRSERCCDDRLNSPSILGTSSATRPATWRRGCPAYCAGEHTICGPTFDEAEYRVLVMQKKLHRP